MPDSKKNVLDVYCVGLGAQFNGHLLPRLLQLADNNFCRIRGVCDRNAEKVSQSYSELITKLSGNNSIDRFDQFDEMLDVAKSRKSHDGYYTLFLVSTAYDSHFHYQFKALQAGFHVYVDKPFATNSGAASMLVDLASKQNRHIVVGAQRRFERAFIDLKLQISKLSRIERVAIHTHGNFTKADPFFIENNLLPVGTGYHMLDTAVWLLDDHCHSFELSSALIKRRGDNPEFLASFDALFTGHKSDNKPVPISVSASTLAPENSVDELFSIIGSEGEASLVRKAAPRNSDSGDVYFVPWENGSEHISIPGCANEGNRAAPLEQMIINIGSRDEHKIQSTGEQALQCITMMEQILKDGRYLN